MPPPKKQIRRKRFDFGRTKAMATSADPAVRKEIFIEYYAEFEEFPSYLFDNEHTIDKRLFETLQALITDPDTTKAMHKGIDELLSRLPS